MKKNVVDGISFEIKKGEIFGLLGGPPLICHKCSVYQAFLPVFRGLEEYKTKKTGIATGCLRNLRNDDKAAGLPWGSK